jgi:RNA ligase (TIGR02306 family)
MEEESNFRVPLTTIKDIIPHPSADRLEIAIVYGFHCIVSKNQHKVGDKIFYIPIDAILPQNLEEYFFPPGSKIDRRSAKRRVRQIRIRSVPSQGMILREDEFEKAFPIKNRSWGLDFVEEQDYASELGITKYEPPEVYHGEPNKEKKNRNKVTDHPDFHKYGGLLNVKWYPEKFKSDEMVHVTEKIHGSNSRASLLPYNANTLWEKAYVWIRSLLKMEPLIEKCYGSNNVQLHNKARSGGYYTTDVYRTAFDKIGVHERLKCGETVYGEVIGWDGEKPIQKHYTYGIQKGECEFVLFDVKVIENGKHRWLNSDEVELFAKERGFNMVPCLYRGPYTSLDFMKQFSIGPSVYDPNTKVREGCVIKSLERYDEDGNKRALKLINEAYLDRHDNTDNH